MKNAIVFGAGISGNGAKETLEEIGYNVELIDDKVAKTSIEGIELIEKGNIDIFIKSPGVPYTDLVKKAVEKGIEIIDDVELGYRYKIRENISGKIIAITGTNGKTTITSKICELLVKSGYKAKVCGNIGYSFSQTVVKNPELDFYILELSSYQLENLKEFKADISLIVNLAPDHLNRYRDVGEYYDTKFNIANNQTSKEHFILNIGCCESMKRKEGKKGTLHLVGVELKDKEQEMYCDENWIIYRGEKIIEISKLSLKGKHNLENSLFIVLVGKLLEISNEEIKEFLYNTETLEHRMEEFYRYGDNLFINDSKGTNIDSTRYAIEAFKNPILICGGSDKKLDLAPLAKIIKNSVKDVYLIGEIADKLERELQILGYNNIYNLKTLEKVIVELKKRIDKDGKEIILFSPATASFDQFKNFEERGKIFKELVRKNFEGEKE